MAKVYETSLHTRIVVDSIIVSKVMLENSLKAPKSTLIKFSVEINKMKSIA